MISLGTLRGADMLLMTLRLAVALSVTVRLRVLCHLPHRGRQEHARGCRLGCGKANLLTTSPYHSFAGFDGGTLGSPCGGAVERSETERAFFSVAETAGVGNRLLGRVLGFSLPSGPKRGIMSGVPIYAC